MPRSFRLLPPEPSPMLLPRPRLVEALQGRWERRVTAVVGGAGLGKTTVLAQAVADNALAPRGQDLWLGLEPHDADAARLAATVGSALPGEVDGPDAVAEALWQLAPTQVCLVFDDVHCLPAGSSGATWLAELIAGLPANGHVVLASRTEPPVPLSRLDAQGQVLRLAEDDLRFSDEELRGFAERRGVDADDLAATGGWPALVVLSAHVDQRLAGAYVWEEVLEPLSPERRHVVAVLADLGGGDDELVAAALGAPVDLAASLEGIPLVARSADGWFGVHALWRQAPGLALDAGTRAEVRRRAVEHLTDLGRFDEAFELVEDAGAWDLAPDLLRAACLASDRLSSDQLQRWLASSPGSVRASLPGRLARGLLAASTAPAAAVEPLRKAIEVCRTAGDLDAEMTAIAQLARIAWFGQDDALLGELAGRVTELEGTGHPTAGALATVARAAVADLLGDDDELLTLLEGIEPSALDRAWELLVSFWAAQIRLGLGETEPIHRIAARLHAGDEPALRGAGLALTLSAWWAEGRVDDVVAKLPEMISLMRTAGVRINLYLALNGACLACARTGDLAAARRWFDESLAVAPGTPNDELPLRSAVALAYLHLADGEEKVAAVILQSAIEAHGIDQGIDRDTWRQHIALAYVLVPDTRAYWDGRRLPGHLRTAHQLARAVVALRERRPDAALRPLVLPEPGVVRAALDVRLAAELAVGLEASGRSADGRTLLAALGPPGRDALRDVGASGHRLARAARVLLAAVPAVPRRRTYLSVLGPVTLRHDGPAGEPVVDPDFRRPKLRTLLGFLVVHRQPSRAAVTAALWPDLDERAGANNLGVTLSRLQRVLEPEREVGEAGYLLRVDGQVLRLVTGEHLQLDIDDFESHLAAATQAEAGGAPSLALEHHQAAMALYGGDLLADLPEADWFSLDREYYRTRFVGAAVRAGQLLLGHADPDAAEAAARRALAADPWAEEAYAILVDAAIARRDHAAARRILHRCLAILHDLGAHPSPITQALRRRLA